MPGMLDLSVASGADLARTADIVSDNMTAMGLNAGTMIKVGKNLDREVEASSHFMDVYAYALTHSNVTLESLGETMKYAAPIANAYGASLEDAAAMTMIMGNAGIKGSMAGTALRMGLLRLSGPPKKATKEMEELGISMSDATKMAYETQAQLEALGVSFDENAAPADKMFQVLTQLSEKTAGLSREEKLAAVGAIFGANAASGWVNILEQGPEVFQKYRDELRECDGYAKSTSDIMKDNLAGAMVGLESAFEAVGLAIGDAFLPQLTQAMNTGAEYVREVAQWIDQHQDLTRTVGIAAAALAGITVAASGVALAGAGFNFLKTNLALAAAQATQARAAVATFWAAQTAGASSSAAVNALNNLAGGFKNVMLSSMRLVFSPAGAALMLIGAAGYYAYQNWDKVAPVLQTIASVMGGTLSTSVSTLTPAFASLANTIQRLAPAFEVLGGAVLRVLLVVINVVVRTAAVIVQTFSQAIVTVTELFSGLGGALASLLAGDFSGAADQFVSTMSKAADNIGKTFTTAFDGIGDTISHALDPVNQLDYMEAKAASQANMSAAQRTAINSAPMSGPMSDDAMFNTQQAQQAVNQLGEAASQNAQTVQQSTTAQQQVQTQVQSTVETLTQVQTNQQAAVENQNLMQQSSQMVTQEFTNLQTTTTATVPQVQMHGTESQAASSQIQQLGSAASSAGSSLSALDGAVSSVASSLSAKANQIASITISAPSVAASPVAANYEGGIYRKGAFLTTFAERSPEAAIPIDGSTRAIELWKQTGAMLGQDIQAETPRLEVPEQIDIFKQIKLPPAPKVSEIKMSHLPERVRNSRSGKALAAAYDRQTVNSISNAQSNLALSHTSTFPVSNQSSQLTTNNSPLTTFFNESTNPVTSILNQSKVGKSIIDISGQLLGGSDLALSHTSTFPVSNQSSQLTTNNSPLTTFFNQSSNPLTSIFGDIFNSDEGGDLNNILSQGDRISQGGAETFQPTINISVTVQGNADGQTMQEASQQMVMDLRRELDRYRQEMFRNRQRGSFA